MEHTISEVKCIDQPSDSFDMYTIGVTLDDGRKVVAFAKSEIPPYKAGEKVWVMDKGTHKKYKCPKVSIKRPDRNGKYDADSSPQRGSYSSPAPQGQSRQPKTLEQFKSDIENKYAAAQVAIGFLDDIDMTEIEVRMFKRDVAITCAYGMVMDGFNMHSGTTQPEQGSPSFSGWADTTDTTDTTDTAGDDEIPF